MYFKGNSNAPKPVATSSQNSSGTGSSSTAPRGPRGTPCAGPVGSRERVPFGGSDNRRFQAPVSYTHLRAHETSAHL
eukprot:15419148-Alexandrium_andersonii.AAC.1